MEDNNNNGDMRPIWYTDATPEESRKNLSKVLERLSNRTKTQTATNCSALRNLSRAGG